MATGADRVAGLGMVALAGAIFLYYTVWMIILPFVDAEHIIHQYFLPRAYAVIIPIMAGVVALGFIGMFMIVVTAGKKKKTS
ncbi:dolichol phosphate-mannose biosynthesis regulatory protein-like [Ptychodera flava]|uniref:dolichol phosphate-mannose biosynthesis regulatory protein-like n=1 Tax=Ptychodera flava TaxID=63121 RepID=UPI00396A2D36